MEQPNYCVKCGTEVKAGTRFCGQCGHEMGRPVNQESLTREAVATTPKKKRNATAVIIAVTVAITIIGAGIFYFASSSEDEERVAEYQETDDNSISEERTDREGLAEFNLNGEKILVSVIDESSPSRALSRVKVTVAEQQGISLVYTKDEGGDFFPEVSFINPTSTRTKATTVAMTPVIDESWKISQPIAVDINPKLFPEVYTVSYSGLLTFLEDEYPAVEAIVFLFDEKTGDITDSTVSIYESPYKGVIYAYLQAEEKTAGFGLFPKARRMLSNR